MLTDFNANANAKAKKQAAKQKHNKIFYTKQQTYIHTYVYACGKQRLGVAAVTQFRETQKVVSCGKAK